MTPSLSSLLHFPRKVAVLVTVTVVAFVATFGFVDAAYAQYGGYLIDGTIPDAGATEFDDPDGSVSELGSENASSTKLGVIHTDPLPTLGFTDPTGKTDFRRVWMDTNVDANDDVWLYFAWERDGNTGSGVIMFEFQKAGIPLGCDYETATSTQLINNCNPFKNRQPGDFIIAWDQQGQDIEISRREFTFDDDNPTNGQWDGPVAEPLELSAGVLLDSTVSKAAYDGTQFYGEAAINLTDSGIFPASPTACLTVGNVIPSTVTGNSDTADFKDIVLDDFASVVNISSCGQVRITKQTEPAGLSGSFPYTLTRTDNSALEFGISPAISKTGTLTGDNDSDLYIDLKAGTNYTLTEGALASPWSLSAITCSANGENFNIYPGNQPFEVHPSITTNCTITNEVQTGKLVVIKNLVNDNGGTKLKSDFSFTVTGSFPVNSGQPQAFDASGITTLTVPIGTYNVSEEAAAGYTTTYSPNPCTNLVVTTNGTTTCTITNDDQPGHLIINKVLINDNGGTGVVTDFFYGINNVIFDNFDVDGSDVYTVNAYVVPYDIVELDAPGYTTTYDNCEDLLIGNGETETCTITNDDQQGTLIVQKIVINDDGGTKSSSDFTFQIDGDTPITFDVDGQNEFTLDSGTYDVTEPSVAGYTTTYDNCDNVFVPNGSIGVCTITNDDEPGTLIVEKVVNNDNGGTKQADDFSFSVNGDTAIAFESDGSNSLTVDAGTYTITETADSGYTTSYTNCTDVTIPNGGSATCTITNDDKQGTLIVEKVVVNDNGGTKTEDDFTFQIDSGTPITFEVDGQNEISLDSGTYDVTEPAVTGYTASYDNCEDVFVPNGGTATCTITNDDNEPSLTLVKEVINDNNGDASQSDWTLSADGPTSFSDFGPSVSSGAGFDAGTYILSESGPSGYSTSGWSCVGGQQNGASVTVALGESATCTIVNDDDAPGLQLLKVASPLTYSAVDTIINYSYILTNTGVATLYQPFEVSDDKATVTCPDTPASIATGESITCTASYVITQADLDNGSVTNNATASAKDPFDETVYSNPDQEVVTAIPAPSIVISKTAQQESYAEPGDVITYTLIATNTGNVTLSSVNITDPKITVLSCVPPQPAILAPGFSITCTGVYTVTLADINFGHFDNTATATGTPPSGPNVTDTDDETVLAVQKPDIDITKTAQQESYDEPGDVITYSLVATNTGNVTLTDVEITDPEITVLDCVPNQGATLDPGESISCTGSYTVTLTDINNGAFSNTATATGYDPNGVPVSDNDTEIVNASQNPAIELTKIAQQEYYSAVGDVITYTLVAENIGNVTLSDVQLTDPLLGTLTECNPPLGSSRDPGETITCTGSYTVTLDDITNGWVDNTASVTAKDPDDQEVSDTDTESVPLAALNITKQATQETFDEVGDVIDYTLIVTNTGNITLHNVEVEDDLLTNLICDPSIPASLAPGDAITCTGSHTITQGDLDAGAVENTATADSNETEPEEDSVIVEGEQNPALAIDKSAEQSSYNEVGDVISYTIVATNTGNITLHNVVINDSLLQNLSCVPDQYATLAPGDSITCIGSYTIQQGDLNEGVVVNTASADSDETGPVFDEVTVEGDQDFALAIDKSAEQSGYDEVGDVISYTIVATNIGNVTLHSVNISDSLLQNLTCVPDQYATLLPGDSITCTGSYTVTQADLDAGTVENTATADSDETGPEEDSVTVEGSQNPVLAIDKTGTEGPVTIGDTVFYTITVTNTGDVTLYDVTVTDAKLGLNTNLGTLTVGESAVVTDTYGPVDEDDLPGPIFNTASAEALSPLEEEVGPVEDTHSVPIDINPDLAIVKTGTVGPVEIGDTVLYTITVTNTGDVTLFDVIVTDAKLGIVENVGALNVGQSKVITDSYGPVDEGDLPGPIFNTAGVTGTTPIDTPVGPVTDTHSVPIDINPGLAIDKTGTTGPVEIGDTVFYTIAVTNTGDVTLYDVTVTDSKLGLDTNLGSLNVGESAVVTDTYGPVNEGDLPGPIFNTASAVGTTPTEQEVGPVEDTHSVPIVINPDLSIDKTGTTSPVEIGDTVLYTITVTNTGDVTLYDVTVTDEKLGLDTNLGTLTVGQSKVVTDSYGPVDENDLPGPIFNTASAEALSPLEEQVGPVEDTHSVPIDINPDLAIVKTGTVGPVEIGDTVLYTITVTNTGDVTLNDVTITDAKLGIVENVGTLNVGQSKVITDSYGPVDEGDLPGPIFNTAGVTGTTPIDTPVGPVTDTHSVPIDINPDLSIDKTGTVGPVEIGDTVLYTITVTNTGDVTLYDVTVTDSKLGLDTNLGSLTVGESAVVTDSYGPVNEGDLPGPIFNTASAVGTTPTEQEVGPVEDTHSVPIDINPNLAIDKTGTEGPVTIGDTVFYTITVTNTGDVTLYDVTVTDALLGLNTNLGTLTVGQSKVVTDSYGPVDENDLPGPIFNTAGAVGMTPTEEPTEPVTDTHETPVTFTPTLAIDKTGTEGPVTIGDTVFYTITVTNTGNVTLNDVTVTDEKLGLNTNLGTLTVGQSKVVTDSYGPITEEDLPGPIFNTAGAVGTTPTDEPTEPVTDTHETPVVTGPALDIDKTGTEGPVTIGDIVFYTITVENVGNVTLNNVTVTDEKLGIVENVGTLIVGQTAQVTGSYGPVTEADLPGPIFNTAGAIGTTPTEEPTEPVTDTHETPVADAPALDIDKTGTEGPVTLGDTVFYTITVQNVGNVTLSNVTVTDEKLGIVENVGTLIVGQSTQITGSYGPVTEADLPGPIFNTAGVTGTTPTNEPTEPVTDTHETPVSVGSSLGDSVWFDENQNGLQDSGEQVVADVEVSLYISDEVSLFDTDGSFVMSDTTDADGKYLFTDLQPGSYYVEFATVEGYSYARYNVNGNGQDTLDSDPLVPWLDVTINASLEEGELGEPLTYTFFYTNTDATLAATNVVISTTIPSGTSFVAASSDPSWNCPNADAGTVCTLTLASLAANASGSATFTVLLNESEPDVPDQLDILARVTQGSLARTEVVTLAAGESNLDGDAGLVRLSPSLTVPTPTAPTNLPPGEQPKQHLDLFLPSLQLSDTSADTSAVEESNTPEPQAAEPTQVNVIYLPVVESQE